MGNSSNAAAEAGICAEIEYISSNDFYCIFVGKSIFQYTAPAVSGANIALSQFRGKSAYLLVNVASQ